METQDTSQGGLHGGVAAELDLRIVGASVTSGEKATRYHNTFGRSHDFTMPPHPPHRGSRTVRSLTCSESGVGCPDSRDAWGRAVNGAPPRI